MARGTLFLLPTALGGTPALAESTLGIVRRLTYFVAENPKSARAFLKLVAHPAPLQDLSIETLDEHTPPAKVGALLEPLEAGTDCGLVSEAGCPAVADPGAPLVRAAHAAGVKVVPLVGPSAILLALMASGMNGQRFAFEGYVPVERAARTKRLKALESVSERDDVTQIFIEAPYRNDALFDAIVQTCRDDTLVCIATDLTLPEEAVSTRTVAQWRKARPAIDRRPTVFLMYREPAPRARSARSGRTPRN